MFEMLSSAIVEDAALLSDYFFSIFFIALP
jgi:hypothetical protein